MTSKDIELKVRTRKITKLLSKQFPDAKCALSFETPFQLLVAVILSAQCTDARVNLITPALFKEAPDPFAMSKLPLARIQELIKSTGFFRNKARNILNLSKILVYEYDGKVPDTMEELYKLPGVGRKSANVILGDIFKVPGIIVDTHVTRLCNRLKLAKGTNAVKLELALQKIVDKKQWTNFSHCLVLHGRHHCTARKPQCATCVISHLCPSKGASPDAWKRGIL